MCPQTVQWNSHDEFGVLDMGCNFCHSFLNLLWYLAALFLKVNSLSFFSHVLPVNSIWYPWQKHKHKYYYETEFLFCLHSRFLRIRLAERTEGKKTRTQYYESSKTKSHIFFWNKQERDLRFSLAAQLNGSLIFFFSLRK